MPSPDDAPNEELAAEAVPGLSAAEGSGDESVLAKYVPRPWRILIGIGFGLYAALLIGDFGYAAYVGSAVSRFEQDLVFDSEGVREGCQAYSRGEGDTALLFVHGFNDSPRIWDELVERAAASGYACRAMRLPGFAERHRDYARHSAVEWARAVAEEVADLRTRHRRVVVVGHSLGGALALQIAGGTSSLASASSDEPPEEWPAIDGLVLVAPAIDVANDRSPVLRVRQWHSISRALLMFTDSTASPFPIDAEDPTADEYEYRTTFTPRRVIDETFRLIDANAARESRLDIPVLLAVADHDHVVDSSAALAWWERLEAPRKQLFIAHESAHAVPLDRDREALAEQILEFIAATESP
ncbi:MAG: alpha/beta fold hydrolase [Planctomycetales bacterium]|nr:alpha/beta fold hydrolase [Planctomycetales bacterium]